MQDNNIIISYSIATRSCCALCIMLAVFKHEVTAKQIEEKTNCKKNTIAKAFDELEDYFDDFAFIRMDIKIDDYVARLKQFKNSILAIKKRV